MTHTSSSASSKSSSSSTRSHLFKYTTIEGTPTYVRTQSQYQSARKITFVSTTDLACKQNVLTGLHDSSVTLKLDH